jgi:hypothetical protein
MRNRRIHGLLFSEWRNYAYIGSVGKRATIACRWKSQANIHLKNLDQVWRDWRIIRIFRSRHGCSDSPTIHLRRTEKSLITLIQRDNPGVAVLESYDGTIYVPPEPTQRFTPPRPDEIEALQPLTNSPKATPIK